MDLLFQYIEDAFVISLFAKNRNTPPTAFSSDLKEASPTPMMTRSSLDPILENLIINLFSRIFFSILDKFLKSEIFAP